MLPDPKVIYEDNHLLVLDKPAGMLTQPSGTHQASLEEFGKQWLKKTHGKPGNVFLEAVHRLDRDAGGIVVFAKTSKALSRMMRAIRERRVKKYYRAQVEQVPQKNEERLVHYLAHREHRAEVVPKEDPAAKQASLTYRLVEPGLCPVLEIELETGRYHQIRCQLGAIGCPILGDKKYGATVSYKKQGIALFQFKMEVPHPVSGLYRMFTIQM